MLQAMRNRVGRRAAHAGLQGPDTTVQWWFCAAEYITDTAMVHAMHPTPQSDAWLRDATLSVARQTEDDWVGPPFRDHVRTPAMGHLETAHLTWATAVVLDLAADLGMFFNSYSAGHQQQRRFSIFTSCLEALSHPSHLPGIHRKRR